MSANSIYVYALEVTLNEEGGYSNHPLDAGKATMRGITTKVYDAYRIGKGLPTQDVALISDEELSEIYLSYWAAIRGDTLPPALAVVAFDVAVNSGPARVLEWLAEEPHDHASLTSRRLQYFTDLKGWPTFGKGWARRAGRVLKAAHKLTAIS